MKGAELLPFLIISETSGSDGSDGYIESGSRTKHNKVNKQKPLAVIFEGDSKRCQKAAQIIRQKKKTKPENHSDTQFKKDSNKCTVDEEWENIIDEFKKLTNRCRNGRRYSEKKVDHEEVKSPPSLYVNDVGIQNKGFENNCIVYRVENSTQNQSGKCINLENRSNNTIDGSNRDINQKPNIPSISISNMFGIKQCDNTSNGNYMETKEWKDICDVVKRIVSLSSNASEWRGCLKEVGSCLLIDPQYNCPPGIGREFRLWRQFGPKQWELAKQLDDQVIDYHKQTGNNPYDLTSKHGNNLDISRTNSDLDKFLVDVIKGYSPREQQFLQNELSPNGYKDYELNTSMTSYCDSQDSCVSSPLNSRRSRSTLTLPPQTASLHYASLESCVGDTSGSDMVKLPLIQTRPRCIANSYSAIRKKELARLSLEKRRVLRKKSSGSEPFERYKCKRGSTELTSENRRRVTNRQYVSLDGCRNDHKIHEEMRYKSEPKYLSQNSEYFDNTTSKSSTPNKYRSYNNDAQSNIGQNMRNSF